MINPYNKSLFIISLLTYPLFYGTWLFYIAFMGLKNHRVLLKEKLGLVWYGLYPIFIAAYFMDILFNIICGTIYFRERPKEWLFTSRCQRHLNSTGKQLARAHFICDNLLNPFEERHC